MSGYLYEHDDVRGMVTQTTWGADFPETVFSVDGGMWVKDGNLVSSTYGRAVLPVAYEAQPSPTEVHALIERFHMARGEYPTMVLVVKLVRRGAVDASFLTWALTRRAGGLVGPPPTLTVHEDVVGFNVILRGAGGRPVA